MRVYQTCICLCCDIVGSLSLSSSKLTQVLCVQTVLRAPDSCKMRTSPGNLLPVTTAPDNKGQNRFVAGDGRVNEHAVLTGMHTLWVREHNRICDAMEDDPVLAGMSTDEKFNRARQVCLLITQCIVICARRSF